MIIQTKWFVNGKEIPVSQVEIKWDPLDSPFTRQFKIFDYNIVETDLNTKPDTKIMEGKFRYVDEPHSLKAPD